MRSKELGAGFRLTLMPIGDVVVRSMFMNFIKMFVVAVLMMKVLQVDYQPQMIVSFHAN